MRNARRIRLRRWKAVSRPTLHSTLYQWWHNVAEVWPSLIQRWANVVVGKNEKRSCVICWERLPREDNKVEDAWIVKKLSTQARWHVAQRHCHLKGFSPLLPVYIISVLNYVVKKTKDTDSETVCVFRVLFFQQYTPEISSVVSKLLNSGQFTFFSKDRFLTTKLKYWPSAEPYFYSVAFFNNFVSERFGVFSSILIL